VVGVAIRMKVAHRYRIHASLQQFTEAGGEGCTTQGGVDGSVEAHALTHPKAQRPWDEGDRRRHAQVIAIVLQSLAHFDDIPMSLGRQ